ncbi:MAG TPA: OFA family MFS transporter, partial [Ktedonobacterales bacterium]
PNRWIIVVAAVIMQLSLGAVYAWSVFVTPLQTEHKALGWSVTQITLTFTIAIAVLGIGAAIGGFWMDRVGPRFVATVAGVCYGLGVLLAGFSDGNLFILYLTYGVIGGLGMGLGYIVPVATLVKWFPDKRGVVTGLAVAGFGAGAVITSPVASALIGSVGVSQTFIILGIVYLILVVAAAQFYSNPPAGYAPPGWTPSARVTAQRATKDFTPGEALTRGQWYVLWAILALNVTAGIAIISQAKPLGQSVGASAAVATGFVSFIAIFNGLGRFAWAWFSDLIGRRQVFITMFALQAVIFFILGRLPAFALFAPLACVVALCYGGGFGTMPAFAADYFGPKRSGAIYGTMLTAWSAGGVLGPLVIAQVKDRTGGYGPAFTIIAVIMLVSMALPLFVRPPKAVAETAPSEQAQPSPA